MRGMPSLFAFKMIYDLIDDFQIDLFEGPIRLRNFPFSIEFDQYLPLAWSGFWHREKLHQKRNVPASAILQLPEYLAQDRPFGFPENDFPKRTIPFKVLFGAVGARYSPCQLVSMVEIGRTKMTICGFNGQMDEGAQLTSRRNLYDRKGSEKLESKPT